MFKPIAVIISVVFLAGCTMNTYAVNRKVESTQISEYFAQNKIIKAAATVVINSYAPFVEYGKTIENYKTHKLTLRIYNISNSPIQTNLFMDSIAIVTPDNKIFALDIVNDASYQYKGRILNPGVLASYDFYIQDSSMQNCLKNSPSCRIAYRLGSTDSTLVLNSVLAKK